MQRQRKLLQGPGVLKPKAAGAYMTMERVAMPTMRPTIAPTAIGGMKTPEGTWVKCTRAGVTSRGVTRGGDSDPRQLLYLNAECEHGNDDCEKG
jgi:hypothetical protein